MYLQEDTATMCELLIFNSETLSGQQVVKIKARSRLILGNIFPFIWTGGSLLQSLLPPGFKAPFEVYGWTSAAGGMLETLMQQQKCSAPSVQGGGGVGGTAAL